MNTDAAEHGSAGRRAEASFGHCGIRASVSAGKAWMTILTSALSAAWRKTAGSEYDINRQHLKKGGTKMPGTANRRTRRSVLRATGLLGSAAMLSALANSRSKASAQGLTNFNIGVSALVSTEFPVWMIQPGGFDKKYGLNVQILDMNGGNRGIQVLLSGDIQAMHVGLGAVVQANAQGANLRMITSCADENPFLIFSSPHVKTAADLKGGGIGISTYGSETEIAVNLALKALGLTRNDVRIFPLGGDAQRLGALMAGQVQAVPLQEPAATKAREAGLNTLVSLPDSHLPYDFDGIVVTTDSIKKNRDLLTRFTRAYVEAAYLALSNQQMAEQIIRTSFKIDDPQAVTATYQSFVKLMPSEAAPSRVGAQNVIQQLENTGITFGSKNPDDYLDFSFIDSLKKTGFFATLPSPKVPLAPA
jgi:NitT/TauT family transport system substrate-binding protein